LLPPLDLTLIPFAGSLALDFPSLLLEQIEAMLLQQVLYARHHLV
jgi:hypothetical protein